MNCALLPHDMALSTGTNLSGMHVSLCVVAGDGAGQCQRGGAQAAARHFFILPPPTQSARRLHRPCQHHLHGCHSVQCSLIGASGSLIKSPPQVNVSSALPKVLDMVDMHRRCICKQCACEALRLLAHAWRDCDVVYTLMGMKGRGLICTGSSQGCIWQRQHPPSAAAVHQDDRFPSGADLFQDTQVSKFAGPDIMLAL